MSSRARRRHTGRFEEAAAMDGTVIASATTAATSIITPQALCRITGSDPDYRALVRTSRLWLPYLRNSRLSSRWIVDLLGSMFRPRTERIRNGEISY